METNCRKLYAKGLASILLSRYKEWLEEENDDGHRRINTLYFYDSEGEGTLTVEGMSVKSHIGYEQKTIGILSFGIEITVEYQYAGKNLTVRMDTDTYFAEDIFQELLLALQDEIDRVFGGKNTGEE